MPMRFTCFLLLLPAFFSFCVTTSAQIERTTYNKKEVLDVLHQVNMYWQKEHPQPGNSFWHVAAYHTGNMAAYEVTADTTYLAYSENWAIHNQWMGARSSDRSAWKYTYGESDDFVLFGDYQTCFQVYIDLYNIRQEERRIARALEVMEYQIATPANDYLWWADGLYMVMPVMTKLYNLTGNESYLQKLTTYFQYAKALMYDEESHLFYRDAKYVYPAHKTTNDKKDFWARGNGWVFAALAKVLDDLPSDHLYCKQFLDMYIDLAKSLSTHQQPEGYWSRSILDPEFAHGYETSGTAFFMYGFLWGLNSKVLDRTTYAPVVKRGWEYLTQTALQANGRVGYVQPIGERASQHKNVGPETTADFGVGAFLLAASEMYKYVD